MLHHKAGKLRIGFSKTANIKRSQDDLAPFPGCSLGAECLRKWNAGGASLTCEVDAQDPGCAPGDRPRTQADKGGGAWSAPDVCPCAGALISVCPDVSQGAWAKGFRCVSALGFSPDLCSPPPHVWDSGRPQKSGAFFFSQFPGSILCVKARTV